MCLQLDATTVSEPGVSWRVEQDGMQVVAGLSSTLPNASLSDYMGLNRSKKRIILLKQKTA